ncbi:hypothetical protein [Pedobacter sp. L105]|uniref:hypothetical protein n=1 Tax=Pedobacter sp. L105 TaxID=1641871 RepID=UPI00131D8636|nr:hypothetical protein [Pedobacter sp. L105]
MKLIELMLNTVNPNKRKELERLNQTGTVWDISLQTGNTQPTNTPGEKSASTSVCYTTATG